MCFCLRQTKRRETTSRSAQQARSKRAHRRTSQVRTKPPVTSGRPARHTWHDSASRREGWTWELPGDQLGPVSVGGRWGGRPEAPERGSSGTPPADGRPRIWRNFGAADRLWTLSIGLLGKISAGCTNSGPLPGDPATELTPQLVPQAEHLCSEVSGDFGQCSASWWLDVDRTWGASKRIWPEIRKVGLEGGEDRRHRPRLARTSTFSGGAISTDVAAESDLFSERFASNLGGGCVPDGSSSGSL